GKPFATIVGAHDSEPWEMSWSPDDRKFAITYRHKRSWEVVVWEISSTKTPIISRQFHATYFLQWSPDNRTFLAFDRHTNLNVLDSVSGQLVNTLTPQLSKTMPTTTFDATGRRIITASIDGPVQVWDVATGKLVDTYIGNKYIPAWNYPSPLVPLVSPDKRFL